MFRRVLRFVRGIVWITLGALGRRPELGSSAQTRLGRYEGETLQIQKTNRSPSLSPFQAYLRSTLL